ncbi:unnamed protein product, partial [Medioppia subpectinata]
MSHMLGPKKSRFRDSATLPIDINNGFNNTPNNPMAAEDNESTPAVNLNPLQVNKMMADIHKQIEERKLKLKIGGPVQQPPPPKKVTPQLATPSVPPMPSMPAQRMSADLDHK